MSLDGHSGRVDGVPIAIKCSFLYPLDFGPLNQRESPPGRLLDNMQRRCSENSRNGLLSWGEEPK